jgi:hypothetical protein
VIERATPDRDHVAGIRRRANPLTPPRGLPRPGSGDLDGALPLQVRFGALVPNPSGGQVQWSFDLPEGAEVGFTVFDLAGRVVHAFDRRMPAGRHVHALDLQRMHGGPGVYFVRMQVDQRTVGTRRLVLRF